MAIERSLNGMPKGEGTLGNLGEVGIEDVLGDLGNGKVLEGTAHVATNVSQLQTPGQHGIDRCTGNYTQGPLLRGGPRQAPVGDGDTHAALNNLRMLRGWER